MDEQTFSVNHEGDKAAEPAQVALTYAEMKERAAQMLREAEVLRKQELKKVIDGIHATMREYGIDATDLGFAPAIKTRAARKVAKEREARIIKYRGPNGEPWAPGPGARPAWVRDLLARGEDLEQYRVAE